MPQMSPLNWLLLFFLFSIIYIMFMILNYFNMTLISQSSKKSVKIIVKPMNWKW
uniref:ATP synthase complex subunit 8 n=1 Tax=Petrobius brevistylis TaxID=50562 RepID=Q2TCR3_9INSE|nr:ATP synthase F0 subunit 8 [Petrobius brevistylis]AAX39853.1 ATP synthase F0 subunit 8 [Petrobius brevistylis]